MSDARRPANAVTDPILSNGNLSDSQVIDVLLSGFPVQVRALVGADVRELMKFAISRERARAASVVARVASLQAHRSRGPNPDAALAGHVAKALAAVAKMIQDAPGACGRCGGARQVSSGLAGPGGQMLTSPCPECSSTPEASAAPVIDMPGKPSDG